MTRCSWSESSAEMQAYHDREWGFPIDDDRRLFEKISLEGFQSGLSWSTILKKRPDFRRVFHEFDIARLAEFDDADVSRLFADTSIIRHQGKIRSVVNNARRCLDLVTERGSLAAYVWDFEPKESPMTGATECAESKALARDLKSRGWSFVGPTTMYAFMQSMGMVNDHEIHCPIRLEVDSARGNFVRPPQGAGSVHPLE